MYKELDKILYRCLATGNHAARIRQHQPSELDTGTSGARGRSIEL
ncbi:hypothetical protein L916_02193 [Phytophthora nicotianae]|uniref:Uncharacterized protein n=1 Tax=Phytophthora nicotianae TaxID=4792 RepID=W2JP65_PHYNI|nr:hypothetical protein L916_02193 [Phytophthora nicotianae]